MSQNWFVPLKPWVLQDEMEGEGEEEEEEEEEEGEGEGEEEGEGVVSWVSSPLSSTSQPRTD